MRWLMRNPVVHFLLLGGVLYWLIAAPANDLIQLHHLQLESGRQAMRATLGVDELTTLQRLQADRRVVEDELLYREALALGLDQHDHIIRQRLVQKMLFLVEDSALPEPEESTLRAHYQAHLAEFAAAPRVGFVHVYLRDADDQRAQSILPDLTDVPDEGAIALGDDFPLPHIVVDAAQTDISANFGEAFARALEDAPVQQWVGPVASRFGSHFVKLTMRAPGTTKSYEQSAAEIAQRWQRAQKQRIHAELITDLRDKYAVEIDPGAPDDYAKSVEEALAARRAKRHEAS